MCGYLLWLYATVISVAPRAVVIATHQRARAFRVGVAVALPLATKAFCPIAAAPIIAAALP